MCVTSVIRSRTLVVLDRIVLTGCHGPLPLLTSGGEVSGERGFGPPLAGSESGLCRREGTAGGRFANGGGRVRLRRLVAWTARRACEATRVFGPVHPGTVRHSCGLQRRAVVAGSHPIPPDRPREDGVTSNSAIRLWIASSACKLGDSSAGFLQIGDAAAARHRCGGGGSLLIAVHAGRRGLDEAVQPFGDEPPVATCGPWSAATWRCAATETIVGTSGPAHASTTAGSQSLKPMTSR